MAKKTAEPRYKVIASADSRSSLRTFTIEVPYAKAVNRALTRHGTCEICRSIGSHYRTDNLNGRIDGTSKIAIRMGPEQTEAAPSRNSMQLMVATKRDGEWRSEGLMNGRRLTMERQFFLDDVDALPAEAQRQLTDLVAAFKKSHL